MEYSNSTAAPIVNFTGTLPVAEPANPTNNNFPLRLAREGDSVQIVAVSGGKKFHDRLIGVGLRVGTTMKIIRNSMNGKLLIGHNNTRLFMGGGMAHRIQVITIEGEKR